MELYEKLRQHRFFHFFRELSDIPRGSGNEQAASDYIAAFARENSLEVYQDQANNVIIKKPSSHGYERAAPVMLQAHMDMVCEKRPNTAHNFLADPIPFVVRGNRLMADGTTLGADDGFGVSYMLAVLESDNLLHPPIEAVFTTDEEVGMGGVKVLDTTRLTSRRLINLDSEGEGELCASCAGGVRYDLTIPVTRVTPSAGSVPFCLAVEGLCGGHSGMDIGRERANSLLLITRVLSDLQKAVPLQVASLTGGFKTNAIPREAYATLWIQPDDQSALLQALNTVAEICQTEYAATEPRLSISIKPSITSTTTNVVDSASLSRIFAALRLLPNGVFAYNPLLTGVLDTSSNVGIAELRADNLFLSGLLRSNTNSKIADITDKLKTFADVFSAQFQTGSAYPAWEYQSKSDLRALCCKVYRERYERDMTVVSTHGGLECGLLAAKLPNLDMISIGPNIHDVHTPQESIEMDSFIRVWEYLVLLLERMRY